MSAKLKAFISGRGYGIFFTALTVLLGIIFLLQTFSIYIDGTEAKQEARENAIADAVKAGLSEEETLVAATSAAEKIDIYSRSTVSKKLLRLIPYVCVWAAALAVDVVLTALLHSDAHEKKRPTRHGMEAQRLVSERKKLPIGARSGCETEFESAYTACINIRKRSARLMYTALALGAVCFAFPFLYFLDASHFPNESLNAEVIRAVLFSLPFLAVLLAVSIAYVLIRDRLIKDELRAIKAAVKSGEFTPPKKEKVNDSARIRLLAVRIAVFSLGVGLVILGVFNGSAREVFVKATKICTECIGLG